MNPPGGAAEPEARLLRPGDWRIFQQVRLAALADAPEAFSSTLERERGFTEQRWRRRLETAATVLAWLDGHPVGTATGRAEDTAEPYSVAGAWQLVGMWVAPGARSSGVADLLVARIGEHAAQAGATALVLWVVETNTRARAFYRRSSFQATGARQLVHEDEPGRWEIQLIRTPPGPP